jgi:hypothetical protein
LRQRRLRLRAEVAVDRAGIEAERVQPFLRLFDEVGRILRRGTAEEGRRYSNGNNDSEDHGSSACKSRAVSRA